MIKIRPDTERSKNLLRMAIKRMRDVNGYPKYKQVEEYWDIAKEIILAILYARGFHTLSHRELIDWLRKEKAIKESQIEVLDMLRKARNGISYYGESELESIIDEHREEIIDAINSLKRYCEKIIDL